MGRIRSLKPEFFLDEELAAVSLAARLCFAGLWTLADAAGRLEDRPARIRAQLFPYDHVDIEEMLGELAAGRFITRYEVEGKRYLEIRSFTRHQRPHPTERAVCPGPPAGVDLMEPGRKTASRESSRQAVSPRDLPGNSRTSRADLGSGIRDQGSGSGEGDLEAPPPPPGPGLGTTGQAPNLPMPDQVSPEPGGTAVLPPADFPPSRPAERPGQRVTAQQLVDTFGRLRSELVPGALPWQLGGAGAWQKAAALALTFEQHPDAADDIEGTMRLLLERTRDSQDPRDGQPAFVFGSWVAQFTALREELRGRRRPAKDVGDVECAFHRFGKNGGKPAPKYDFSPKCPECRHVNARASPRAAAAPAGIGEVMNRR